MVGVVSNLPCERANPITPGHDQATAQTKASASFHQHCCLSMCTTAPTAWHTRTTESELRACRVSELSPSIGPWKNRFGLGPLIGHYDSILQGQIQIYNFLDGELKPQDLDKVAKAWPTSQPLGGKPIHAARSVHPTRPRTKTVPVLKFLRKHSGGFF